MKYIPFAIRRRFLPESIQLHQPANQNKKPMTNLLVEPTKYLCGGKITMSQYENDGSIAFNVADVLSGKQIYTATLNIPQATFPANQRYVYLRSWGQYEGVPEAFQKTGLVKITGLYHQFPSGEKAILVLVSPRLDGVVFKPEGK